MIRLGLFGGMLGISRWYLNDEIIIFKVLYLYYRNQHEIITI